MNDFDKFKEDYPAIYEKFLEMNRALSALQKAVKKNANTPQIPSGDLPTELEWE